MKYRTKIINDIYETVSNTLSILASAHKLLNPKLLERLLKHNIFNKTQQQPSTEETVKTNETEVKAKPTKKNSPAEKLPVNSKPIKPGVKHSYTKENTHPFDEYDNYKQTRKKGNKIVIEENYSSIEVTIKTKKYKPASKSNTPKHTSSFKPTYDGNISKLPVKKEIKAKKPQPNTEQANGISFLNWLFGKKIPKSNKNEFVVTEKKCLELYHGLTDKEKTKYQEPKFNIPSTNSLLTVGEDDSSTAHSIDTNKTAEISNTKKSKVNKPKNEIPHTQLGNFDIIVFPYSSNVNEILRNKKRPPSLKKPYRKVRL